MMGGFAEKLPSSADNYQELVSSDDEDFSEPDDGSVGDLEMTTWADWCSSAFGTNCVWRVSTGSGRYTAGGYVQ